MTKRELTNWLESQRNKTIREMEKEIQQRKDAVLEAKLRPLGFYEMAGQVESLLRQAWDLWITWKVTHENDLEPAPNRYNSFEHQIKPLVHIEIPLAEYMAQYDINLRSDALEALKKEERMTSDKIAQTYNRVINAVYASKNVKEAKAYVEGLGFDLSELENPPAPVEKAAEIDTSFLFLKSAA